MSKDQIKYEINKVLDHFPDSALQELLTFLKELETRQHFSSTHSENLKKILLEDTELLEKLAQ